MKKEVWMGIAEEMWRIEQKLSDLEQEIIQHKIKIIKMAIVVRQKIIEDVEMKIEEAKLKDAKKASKPGLMDFNSGTAIPWA